MNLADRTILVAGCGYLGLEVAKVFKRHGWRVCGLSRTAESCREIARAAGIEMVSADLTDRDSLRAAKGLLPRFSTFVHCASSSRGGPEAYEKVFVQGLRNLVEEFEPNRFLFTGSTSVYAQLDGSEVNESSPAEPATETGKLLVQAEQVALQAGGLVARLAGLYGPDRSVILRRFFQRTAVLEDGGDRIINQIHRDDAAGAIFHLLAETAGNGRLYNVTDDEPMTQREIMEWLAALYRMPVPPEGPRRPSKRGRSSKRISNARLRETGWQPAYPSFRDAVSNDRRLAASIQCQLVIED